MPSQCVYRSPVQREWVYLPVQIDHQVEKMDDGTETHTIKHPRYAGVFTAGCRRDALSLLTAALLS